MIFTSKSKLRRLAGLAAVLLALPALAAGETVDPREDRGVWEGWGCSLCWWGNGIGKSAYEDLHADLFFTTKMVSYAGQELPGLGMTIVRYNVGGGGQPGDPGIGVKEMVSPTMPWFKDIDGYWLGNHANAWDWSRDANQRSQLQAACRRGVTQVEFFANAPMWWMMASASSAGGNLRADQENDFARYLATVVAKAQGDWQIPVASIDPFNEPQADWWKYPMQQEGCHIPREQQKNVLVQLRNELDARKLNQVQIAAADENSIPEAKAGYDYFKAQGVADRVGKVNVHAYSGLKPWRDNAARTALRQAVGKKRLWMSEYGDGDESGMTLARTIIEDLNWLRPTAWIYWQPVEPYSAWGLVNADYQESPTLADRGKPRRVYTKYYVFAQFSRFLRPGCRLIGSNDPNSVVAYDAASQQLILIILSEIPQQLDYDLSAFATLGATADVTRTQADGRASFITTTLPIKDKKLSLQATGKAVSSLVIKDVRL